ncbi:MAG: hypothetical protein HY744_05090 [Deltaproteobacteria bacterium]|nr:hypothetical protein [Deltaproteobacteria bacterium]
MISDPAGAARAPHLCGGCGVFLPATLGACDVCGAPAAAARPAPPLPAEGVWARIECRFACPSCGVLTPINHLDADGSVTCAHCALEQSLDIAMWRRVLPGAHEVADLSGVMPWIAAAPANAPLVHDNPYRHVGLVVSHWDWSEHGVVGARAAVAVRASPGRPLCARCRSPVTLRLGAGGHATASCAACAVDVSYALPREAPALYAPAAAVLAPEHRTDRRAAVLRQEGGATTAQLVCPTCGGPLTARTDAYETECGYCRLPVLVSTKLWARLGLGAPRTEGWWVLLRGPSARRQKLEQDAARPDALQDEIAARARAAAQQAGGGVPGWGQAPGEAAPEGQASQSGGCGALALLAAILLVLGLGAF